MAVTMEDYEIIYKAYTLSGHVRHKEEDYIQSIPKGTEVHINTLIVLEDESYTNIDRIHGGYKYYGEIKRL